MKIILFVIAVILVLFTVVFGDFNKVGLDADIESKTVLINEYASNKSADVVIDYQKFSKIDELLGVQLRMLDRQIFLLEQEEFDYTSFYINNDVITEVNLISTRVTDNELVTINSLSDLNKDTADFNKLVLNDVDLYYQTGEIQFNKADYIETLNKLKQKTAKNLELYNKLSVLLYNLSQSYDATGFFAFKVNSNLVVSLNQTDDPVVLAEINKNYDLLKGAIEDMQSNVNDLTALRDESIDSIVLDRLLEHRQRQIDSYSIVIEENPTISTTTDFKSLSLRFDDLLLQYKFEPDFVEKDDSRLQIRITNYQYVSYVFDTYLDLLKKYEANPESYNEKMVLETQYLIDIMINYQTDDTEMFDALIAILESAKKSKSVPDYAKNYDYLNTINLEIKTVIEKLLVLQKQMKEVYELDVKSLKFIFDINFIANDPYITDDVRLDRLDKFVVASKEISEKNKAILAQIKDIKTYSLDKSWADNDFYNFLDRLDYFYVFEEFEFTVIQYILNTDITVLDTNVVDYLQYQTLQKRSSDVEISQYRNVNSFDQLVRTLYKLSDKVYNFKILVDDLNIAIENYKNEKITQDELLVKINNLENQMIIINTYISELDQLLKLASVDLNFLSDVVYATQIISRNMSDSLAIIEKEVLKDETNFETIATQFNDLSSNIADISKYYNSLLKNVTNLKLYLAYFNVTKANLETKTTDYVILNERKTDDLDSWYQMYLGEFNSEYKFLSEFMTGSSYPNKEISTFLSQINQDVATLTRAFNDQDFETMAEVQTKMSTTHLQFFKVSNELGDIYKDFLDILDLAQFKKMQLIEIYVASKTQPELIDEKVKIYNDNIDFSKYGLVDITNDTTLLEQVDTEFNKLLTLEQKLNGLSSSVVGEIQLLEKVRIQYELYDFYQSYISEVGRSFELTREQQDAVYSQLDFYRGKISDNIDKGISKNPTIKSDVYKKYEELTTKITSTLRQLQRRLVPFYAPVENKE